MEFRAEYKNAKVSPKKARDVAREIQGMQVSEAINTLTFTPRKAARFLNKTLKSAVANASNISEEKPELNVDIEGLRVKEAVVNDGRTLKRYKPRARGSAGPIRKRQSHLTIIISDSAGSEEKEKSADSKDQK
ncbi:50S ribosomal protein L22 [Verrucomicrobiales bacterium]|nr:50S ribosomal protein L22 [Verrucomicrobiales bacterium]MDB4737887.1 50S ribosomal protein L22 [Verrucomicrobiales bacterium]NCG27282.1 50S ribosomal protein L22 [Verrucomicrobiales bacterium]|tara:strand:+ start:60 stop:458 length:399 start_codon:yes stop_codon:yes gene_type:complete